METQFDVIIIGSGPGGYVSAIRAAQLGLKTACIEKSRLGGTCLNVGCIPSKALLHSSEIVYQIERQAEENGVKIPEITVDFSQMMERKKGIISQFNQGIAALFKKNKVTHIEGEGKLISKTEVEVNGQKYEGKSIVLATGSESVELPFLPYDEKQIVSSTGALSLEKIPEKMVVVGAGVIGVELGSVYQRLGTEVTFVEYLDRACPMFDREISKQFKKILEKQGMAFHFNTKVTAAEKKEGKVVLTAESKEGSETTTFEADVVLVAVGRKPYSKGLGLENAGVECLENGTVKVNGAFQTNIPNIYAIGDLIDGPMLAHKASEEGIILAELLAGKNSKFNYITIPNIVYTHPEVASVGFTEEELKEKNIDYKVSRASFIANSRAKCVGETEGFMKALYRKSDEKLLGVHILGPHASELIAAPMVAIQQKMTVGELASLPYAHPTLTELLKDLN